MNFLNLFKPRSLKNGIQLALGFTLLAKLVGYVRQLLVAYCYGVSRDLDIYMMTFNLTMLLVFVYTLWFDQISISYLVRTREQEGDSAFRELCGSFFTFSIVMGIAIAVIFALVVPLAIWVFCHGFTPIERERVHYLSFYFIPWILVIFPYNALTAIIKSRQYYDAVFIADLVVSVIATGGFALWHKHLVSLPITLSLGYCVAIVGLGLFAWRFTHLWGPLMIPRIRGMYKNFWQMFLVNPTSFLASGTDRFFQSYLNPGAIAAAGYAYQTLSPMIEVLGFDDLYVVPLSSTNQRKQRLERLLKGIVLLTIPITCFIMWHTSDIVRFLYERGRFDAQAQLLTTRIFQLLAITLVTATFAAPLIRMLQISNRIIYSGYISVATAIEFLVLNSLFVFKFHWNVIGTTLTAVIGSFLTIFWALFFLHRTGTTIDYKGILKYVVWALVSSGIAIWAIVQLPLISHTYLLNTAFQGLLFLLFILAAYWPVRSNVRFILHG